MPIQVHSSDNHEPGRSCPLAPLRASRRRTRNIITTLSTLLMAALIISCSPVPSDAPPSSATPASGEGYALLSDQQGDSPLEPGPYAVSVADAPSAPVLPVLTVPKGYSAIEDGIGVIAGEKDERFVWVWNIELVNTHPCDAGGYAAAVGPSAADLANALASQPLRNGTEPVPVSIGSYNGFYVEVSVPDDIDIDKCGGGQFRSWPGRAQQDGAGQVDMLWILDVDGQRITFDASYATSASPAEVEELKNMVTTATFETAKEAD